MRRRTTAIVLAILLTAIVEGPASAAHLVLKESGSAQTEPLFRQWARDYARSHPDVTVTTAATSSRQGTLDAFSGAIQIGGADTFLSEEEAEAHPAFIDIALATSALAIAYNLPELKTPLKLDGQTLAAIYDGTIRSWDDKAIAALNPEVALPHRAIIPMRLARHASQTLLLEQYIAAAPTGPEEGAGTTLDMPDDGWSERSRLRTSIAWAAIDGAHEAEDDDGMVEMLARTPYSIGYASFTFADRLTGSRLGLAAIRSRSDEFVLPEVRTLAAAAASLTLRMPADMRLSQVAAPGTGCYPLVNYEYAVVSTHQESAEKAAALRDFLEWAISRDAASFERLAAAHLVGLPSSTWLKSLSQIDRIR